jgi:hypothetical protein
VHLKVVRFDPLNSHACRFVAALLADALKFPADRWPFEFPLTLIRASVVGLPTGKANAHRAIGIEALQEIEWVILGRFRALAACK